MLKDHWARVDALAVGESIGMISISQMPPWNDLCSQLDWEFHTLDDEYFGAKQYGFCGVYRLIALTSEGDPKKPAVLNRLCSQDTTGTLYIGETMNLSSRLNQLRRSARSHRPERPVVALAILHFPHARERVVAASRTPVRKARRGIGLISRPTPSRARSSMTLIYRKRT
jgi:hypothetical protein